MIDCLKNPSRFLFAATLIFSGGCNDSLNIKTESEVPVPQLSQLPLDVGVYYEEGLRNHIYSENSEDRPNWKVNTGDSQIKLFDRILPAMFRTVQQVDGINTAAANKLDVVLVPHVEDMQFALPRETGTDLYEAWIKYRLNMYDNQGVAIADWTIAGYGKSPTEFLGSREEGIQEAINSAFRDAGARFSLSFTRNEDVEKWLSGKLGDCAANPEDPC